MKPRMMVGALVLVATALVGCSKTETTTPTSTSAAVTSPTTASSGGGGGGGTTTATLSLTDCATVAMANLDLIGGKQEAVATLKSFNPPSDVASAIDTVAKACGIKISADTDKAALAASETITSWVKVVCPVGS